jgi:hemerythrin-like domain-containing protein
MFASVLAKVAATGGRALSEPERDALEAALKYFREAAPKHTEDEEDSLFPRLRAAADGGAEGVAKVILALQQDHERAAVLHTEAEGLGTRWLASGCLDAEQAQRFAQVTGELLEMYRSHIALEETEAFPAARRLLSEAELRGVGREMAARRGLEPTAARSGSAGPEKVS